MGFPVPLEFQNGLIDLGFEGDFNIEIAFDRGHAGQAEPFIIFPLRQLGMPLGGGYSLEDLHLAFPAGGAPPAGGIDMNPGLHGGLKEIGF